MRFKRGKSLPYFVIQCTNLKCNRYSYCKVGQKTKKCPYCGRTITISRLPHLIRVETVKEAQYLVKKKNVEIGKLSEPYWYDSDLGS